MDRIACSWFDPPLVLDVGSLPVKCHDPGALSYYRGRGCGRTCGCLSLIPSPVPRSRRVSPFGGMGTTGDCLEIYPSYGDGGFGSCFLRQLVVRRNDRIPKCRGVCDSTRCARGCIEVTAVDRERLTAVVADRNSLQKHVWRARIILATAESCGTAKLVHGAANWRTLMDTEVRLTHRWRELDSNHRSRLFEVAFQRRRRERFVADSSLEEDGFELPVRGR